MHVIVPKEIVNEVVNYFLKIEKHRAGRHALNRTSEAIGSSVSWRCTLVDCYVCVGISKWTIMTIGREASSGGPAFSSTAKRYKVSRRCVLIDTFAHAAIRRRMFQVWSLSLKHSVGVGDGRRDSDCDNDSSGCVKTDPVTGAFNQH